MDLTNIKIQEEHVHDVSDLGLVVKCFTSVGIINGMGKIEVIAREFIFVDSQRVGHFVNVEVTPSSEYSGASTASIRYDDIQKVVRAIEALMAINPNSTKFAHMEAEFSLEDLRLVAFNTNEGKLMCGIGAGSATVFLTGLGKLEQFKSLLLKGKSLIDLNRSH